MPELPEVEHARRHLETWLHGATIVAAHLPDRRITRGSGAAAKLAGRRVREVARRGKWLRIGLDDGTRLFSHLGMTGHWQRRAPGSAPLRFERASLDVARRGRAGVVAYVDARRFGRLVVARSDIPDIPEWTDLGPDPLADGIDARRLEDRLARVRRSIKEALLDQTLLAGVGNIHAIEALFRARIDPRARASALSPAAVRALGRAISANLKEAVRRDEAASDDTITYVEEGGKNPFRVYGRAGEPCPRCRRPLVRIVQGGRGTVFCARCQRIAS